MINLPIVGGFEIFLVKMFDELPRVTDNQGNLLCFEPSLLATARDGGTTPPERHGYLAQNV